jgi:hypothetical protein
MGTVELKVYVSYSNWINQFDDTNPDWVGQFIKLFKEKLEMKVIE